MTPIAKQSKKARKVYYAGKRGSWNGVCPVTRVAKSGKAYDRRRFKEGARNG